MRQLFLSLVLAGARFAEPRGSRVQAQPQCGSIAMPKKLPAVDQLLDSARLAGSLASFQEGEFLISLVPGRDRLAVRPIGSGASAPDSLLRIVEATLRSPVTIDAPSVRLRLHLASHRLTVERSELCGPVSLDAGRIASATITTTSPPPARIQGPRIRVQIGEDGSVSNVELVQSSGLSELDQEILRSAQQARYRPAQLDGRPVAVWWERGHAELVGWR